jgi:hypothetical protein
MPDKTPTLAQVDHFIAELPGDRVLVLFSASAGGSEPTVQTRSQLASEMPNRPNNVNIQLEWKNDGLTLYRNAGKFE